MGPVRIQRKRTKAWKMPPNTVYVGRPTKWGNPFKIVEHGRNTALNSYEVWLTGTLESEAVKIIRTEKTGFLKPTIEEIKQDLAGKNLACWCKLGEPCHADILLKIANT